MLTLFMMLRITLLSLLLLLNAQIAHAAEQAALNNEELKECSILKGGIIYDAWPKIQEFQQAIEDDIGFP